MTVRRPAGRRATRHSRVAKEFRLKRRKGSLRLTLFTLQWIFA